MQFLQPSGESVAQTFRYLPPGEFWMGSPDDEPGRDRDESPRHRVGLTQGFWLADTTCTQALWLAVMGGKNPSHFNRDEQRPVENVTFDDVQTFLVRIQALLPPGCEAVLPTEAQWEYACRAGTDTAFSTGTTIDRSRANFDADVDMLLAPRGEKSYGTVPVKSLPPNAWGLHEMHGNVWEWCDDFGRDYAATAVADGVVLDLAGKRDSYPEARRAVRGGSWLYHARGARSACRAGHSRNYRDHALGFRLALMSISPGGPEGHSLESGPEGRDSLAVAGQDAPPGPRRNADPPGLWQRPTGARTGKPAEPSALKRKPKR